MARPHQRLHNEARALRQSGETRQALMAYTSLLLQFPEAADAWAEFGDLLLLMNSRGDARDAFTRSLALDPTHLPALAGLGRVSLRLGQLEDAEAHLGRALSIAPQDLEVRLDLARCHWRQGHLDRALAVLGPAVDQDPANQVVTRLLIDIYIRQGRWPELHREMLRRANLDYSGPVLEWEVCCINLLFGAMPLGWDQHEARWNHPGLTYPKREFPQPIWAGEPLAGRTLLLHCEQGFGDTLMFVRYAALVEKLGAKVILLVQPELADLVATCPGVEQVLYEEGPLPPFDVHLPLLSLPHMFKTTLDSIPTSIPYLEIPELVPNRRGLDEFFNGSQGRSRRVGISWAGNPNHARDAQRSIPTVALVPLQALPNVAWYAFQQGTEELPPLSGIQSISPLLSNFSDTADALKRMDLLITVDTAIAHLAGALGVPTLLLVSQLPDWRWLMGRDDSPWYPTLRIYRQSRAGDWASVLERVVRDLSPGGSETGGTQRVFAP